MGDEGAGSLTGMLGQCSSLATLILRYNGIGYEGAWSLSGVLGQCSSLTWLDLQDNDDIGVEGIAMIQKSMPDTVELQL